LVQLHGTNAAVGSDNKGIDELLIPVREQIKDRSMVAAGKKSTHTKGFFHKEHYSKLIW
jgi:hypothetical protein